MGSRPEPVSAVHFSSWTGDRIHAGLIAVAVVVYGFMGSDWFWQRDSEVEDGLGGAREEPGAVTLFPALWGRSALFRWFHSSQKGMRMGKGQMCCGEPEVQKTIFW